MATSPKGVLRRRQLWYADEHLHEMAVIRSFGAG